MIIAGTVAALVTVTADAQTKLTENTVLRDEGTPRASVTVADLAWLAGHWQGEGLGGIVEEFWAPQLGESMMGAFKLVANDRVEFQEMMMITPDSVAGLALVLKHFDPDMKGWEHQDSVMAFRLVRVAPGFAYFSGLTFERVGSDGLRIYLAMRRDDGVSTEVRMNYHRVGSAEHERWRTSRFGG